MSVSGKVEFDNLIPEVWSPLMYAELRNKIAFMNFCARTYEGSIANLGDVVRVNQIQAPEAEILTDDKDQFASQALSTSQFSITVSKRAVASYEVTDTAMLQSLKVQGEIRDALVYSIRKKIESDIITALVASASAPDHQIGPASANVLAAADVGSIRSLLATAKVPVSECGLFLAPSYFTDLLNSSSVTSRDFGDQNSAMSGIIRGYMGMNVMEHDLLGNDIGYALHPSALQLVIQQDVNVKVSDLHSQRKFGMLISADILYGFTLADNDRLVKISG
jgi:hypothetical protein